MATVYEWRETGELARRKQVVAAKAGPVLQDDVDWANGAGRYACGNCGQPLTDEELRWYGVATWDGEMICEECIAFPHGVLTARIERQREEAYKEQLGNYFNGW